MKSALRFAVIAALVFAVLMAPWPGLRAGYAACFRVSSEITFSLFWLGGEVGFEPYESGEATGNATGGELTDTFIRVVEDGGPAWFTLTQSHGAGYLPMAVFLALLVATPISRRRKWGALVPGALLVHVYVTALLWINLLEGLTRHAARCPTAIHADWLQSGWWSRVLETAIVIFRLEPTVFIAAPVLAWLVTSIRSADLMDWAGHKPRFLAIFSPHGGS